MEGTLTRLDRTSLRPASLFIGAIAMLLVVGATPGQAQMGPSGLVNPNRDCQTILRCNFTRNGSYRGCISAYSCRVCRLVREQCAVGNISANCQRMRCSWGS